MSAQENKNRIDGLFKSSFDNAELKPSEHIWFGLETKFLNDQAKKDRKKIFYLRWLVAASGLLIVSFTLFYVLEFSRRSGKSKNVAEVKETQEKNQNLENNIAKETIPGNIPSQQNKNYSGSFLTDKNDNIIKSTDDKSHHISKEEKEGDKKTIDNDKAIVNKPGLSLNESQPDSNKTDVNMGFINDDNKTVNKNSIDVFQSANKQSEILKDSMKTNMEFKNDFIENNIVIQVIDSSSLTTSTDSTKYVISSQVLKEELKQNSNDNNKIQHWWVGAMYSPDYCYQRTVITDAAKSNENINQIKKAYEKNAKPKYGFTAGLQLGYKLNEKWNFQTGIMYSDKGEKTTAELSVDTMYHGFQPTGSGGTSSNTSFDNADIFTTVNNDSLSRLFGQDTTTINVNADNEKTVNYNYEYFDVPFLVTYHFGKSKFNFHVSVGASASFFYRYRMIITSNNSQDKKIIKGDYSPFKKVYYSALLGLGAEYKFNSKLSINLEPTFRYGITSIVKNVPINGYLHSLGLATSIRYCF